MELVKDEQTIADARAAIEATLAPLREHRANVQELIAIRLQEVDELRVIEKDLDKMIRAADPTEPGPGRKSKAQPVGNGYPVSDEKIEALLGWLREHPAVTAERFSVPKLTEHEDWQKLMSHQTANAALQALTARGVLRLDRVAGTNRRDYKTTKAFDASP
jgi:hypothetical protein